MKRLLALLALALVLACTPSAVQIQAQAAQAVAVATNAALPLLVDEYERQGDDVIGASASIEAAHDGLAKLRDKWTPIWAYFDAYRAAHDAWATALERGEADLAVVGRVREAYCLLRFAAPSGVELPDWPIVPCGGERP